MNDLTTNPGLLGRLTPSVTLALSARAKELKEQGLNVCSMAVGEPDFDTPEAIKNACIESLLSGQTGYIAASGLPALKQAIVKKLAFNGIKTTARNIIISTGAKFALFEAICALCGKDDEVIVPAPYWLSYPEMIKASGAKLVVVQTNAEHNFEPEEKDLREAITNKTKLIIINSPNNPTGSVYSLSTLQMIARLAVEKNIMVLSDEIYEKLIYDPDIKHLSLAGLNEQIADLTITVNGFSKAYAMTGWRLGYLNAPLWLVERISALQSHATSNATTFVQYAALAALEGKADSQVKHMIETFGTRRRILCQLLEEVPLLSFNMPQGAFYVLCDISRTGLSADEFASRLLEEKLVVVTPCTAFGAPRHIRLSYACSEQNIKESVQRIKDFCESITLTKQTSGAKLI